MRIAVSVALLVLLAGCAGLSGPATDPGSTSSTTPSTDTRATIPQAERTFSDRSYLVIDRADQSEAARVFNSSEEPERAVLFENLPNWTQETFLELYSDLDQRIPNADPWPDRTRYVYYDDTWWEVTEVVS